MNGCPDRANRPKAACYRAWNAGVRITGYALTFGVALALVAMPLLESAHSQAGRPAAKPWTAPRTPWGHPDLQGIWSNATTTPLERPAEFANKPVLSDEEFAASNAAVANRRNTDQRARSSWVQ